MLATAQGAVDDLDRVLAILVETGYTEERFYIHCDGALFGLMVRTVRDARLPLHAVAAESRCSCSIPRDEHYAGAHAMDKEFGRCVSVCLVRA